MDLFSKMLRELEQMANDPSLDAMARVRAGSHLVAAFCCRNGQTNLGIPARLPPLLLTIPAIADIIAATRINALRKN
jgi:hypothetical protein